MKKEILKLQDVSYRYDDADINDYVLKNINYSFELGKIYAIKGKSGSGKTTLLSLISGLETKYEGTITYDDKDLKKIDLDKYRNTYIGIARSLSYNPNIIIADEPTGNLDKETEDEILKIFKDLARKENKCIIIVTHSKNVCDNVDVVYDLKKTIDTKKK